MENLTVLSTIFWLCILAKLSIVSMLFSNAKFKLFFQNFLPWILSILSLVLISFSNGKSERSFNNILVVHFSQSIHRLNLFFTWKM